jgi:hypothetical protein
MLVSRAVRDCRLYVPGVRSSLRRLCTLWGARIVAIGGMGSRSSNIVSHVGSRRDLELDGGVSEVLLDGLVSRRIVNERDYRELTRLHSEGRRNNVYRIVLYCCILSAVVNEQMCEKPVRVRTSRVW